MMTNRNGSHHHDDSRTAATAVTVIAAAVVVVLAVRWLSRQSPLTLAGLAAGAAAVLFGGWAVWPRQRLPRHRVRHMRLRARLRLHPGPGHATAIELWLRWGRLASARRARRSRPSLSRMTRLFRPSQTSVLVARGHYGHRLRVPLEEHVIYDAPPRSGKTGTLAKHIVDYPGTVVATSTRADLYELTVAARAARGPVYVWNPQGLADVPSTMRWDVLGGCADPATAIRRAQPLSSIASFKGEGEDFWAASVALWMQTLLHVAALQQTTMDQVHSWALQKVPEDFLAALPAAGGEAERWGHLIKGQMTSAASRTTDTIRYMLAASLAFMVDPVLRTAVQPGPGQFDPARFVREGGTLYLIAESRDERPSPVAGLFAALVMEIYHQAAQTAARMPGGRLDPPMLWPLDEITQTCPVPLPSLLADAGGRGIQIMPVVHGVSQLRARWGKDGARTILDTCGTKVFLPGISDPETLEMASKLSGTTAARERGHEHDSRHPVMTEDMIRQLPARRDGTGYAFILRNGLSPVIGRPPVIWHGQLWRRLTRWAHQPPTTHQPAAMPPPGGPWPDEDPPAAPALPPRGPAPVPPPAAPPAALPPPSEPPRPAGNRPARARRAWDSIGGQS
jgi:type IV secretion system protein VirD4